MEPWMIGLGMVVMLTAMLVTVVVAGRHVDRQHEQPEAELPPVVREAEEIVRSAEFRMRRGTGTDCDL